MISVADARISLTCPLVSESTFDRTNAEAASSRTTQCQWDRLVDDLDGLRELRDDWDGQGARAPDSTNVDQAVFWMNEMRRWRRSMPPTRVSPGTLGEVILEWREESFHLVAEVGGSSLVDWLLNLPGEAIRQWQTDARCAWIVRADN